MKLAGGETTGIHRQKIVRPGGAQDCDLILRPCGTRNVRDKSIRWFYYRLISIAPPAQLDH